MTHPGEDQRLALADEIAKVDQEFEREKDDAGYRAFVRIRRIWPELKAAALRSAPDVHAELARAQGSHKSLVATKRRTDARLASTLAALQQIYTVCNDNARENCDQRMTVNFIRDVACNAFEVATTRAISDDALASLTAPGTDGEKLSPHNEFNPETEYPGSYGATPASEKQIQSSDGGVESIADTQGVRSCTNEIAGVATGPSEPIPASDWWDDKVCDTCCLAAKRDGVICPDDSCDIQDGVRPSEPTPPSDSNLQKTQIAPGHGPSEISALGAREGMTCYERDEDLCSDEMCMRVGCRIRNERLASVRAHRREADPVGWFNSWNDYHGYQQVAKEFEGSEGTIPLYAHPPQGGDAREDIRWAVNVLLEKIAVQFEGWDTMDLWRSDAARTVRSFKHDLAAPPAPVRAAAEPLEMREALEIARRMIRGDLIEHAVVDVQSKQSLGDMIDAALSASANEAMSSTEGKTP